jgi:hypothetical protein
MLLIEKCNSCHTIVNILESFLNILLHCLIDRAVSSVEVLYVQTYGSKRLLSAAVMTC